MLEKSVDTRKVFFRQQNLCDTLAGNSCSLVTITACPTSRAWKHLPQLRKSDTKTFNESDLCSCVDTPVNWASDAALGLYSAVKVCVCVHECVCSYSLADLQGTRSIWALTPPVRGGVEELQCGWVDVCGEDSASITTWSICYARSQKLKELGEHIWIFFLFCFFFGSCFKGNMKSKRSLFTYTLVLLFDLSLYIIK